MRRRDAPGSVPPHATLAGARMCGVDLRPARVHVQGSGAGEALLRELVAAQMVEDENETLKKAS